MNTLRSFISLAKPYWGNTSHWFSWLLLISVLGFNLAIIGISVLINQWNKVFYDALIAFESQKILPLLFTYLSYMALIVLCIVCGNWLKKLLIIKWREHLSASLSALWLERNRFYRVSFYHDVDNPDQRIAEDVFLMVDKSVNLLKSFVFNLAKLLSFIGILWEISGTQSFMLFGIDIIIKGYLVWIALGYTLVCSFLTHFIGEKLQGLNVEKQKVEANYRGALLRLSDNAEQIAFLKGNEAEQKRLNERFGAIIRNWYALMHREFKLESFSAAYLRITLLIPLFASLPLYLNRTITFGGVMQANSAFYSVQDGFAWFMDSYKQLMEFSATVQRLFTFVNALETIPAEISIQKNSDDTFTCKALSIYSPQNERLFNPIDFSVFSNEWLHISGKSGVGKSTLFRTFAGMWPYNQGQWTFPKGEALFLPQKAYLPKESLKALIAYPHLPTQDDAQFIRILQLVGLEKLNDRLHVISEYSHVLSGGEQQRLSFARVFYMQPRILFLDEATSALDADAAYALLVLLKKELPQTMVIGIFHQSDVVSLFDKKVEL